MISTQARVVTPCATWHLRPPHGVSTPIWLSVNCYCFAPHHKSLSVLSLVSVSTLFFPKIISRCICRMAIYICTSLRSRRPKDFGNQIRTVRKIRGRARSCVSTLLLRPIWLVRLPRKLQQVWFLTLQALRVISIKFLLVISMLRKTEWSWELQTWSPKMNLLYILSTSPH